MARWRWGTAWLIGCMVLAACSDGASDDGAPPGDGPAPAAGEQAPAPGLKADGGPADAPASPDGGTPATGDAGPAPASDAATSVEGVDAAVAPERPADLSHTFDPLILGPGEEDDTICQSWTLNNETPLWVNTVRAENQGAYHHSNWIWVPDSMFPGDDGTWPCLDRGFDQILAGAAGGVFFAQSTQARTDVQRFPDGVAFQVPAHARVIGNVHVLNVSTEEVETQIHFDVFTIPEDEVRVALSPMAFTNLALEIPAGTDTRARMQCTTPAPDFDIYYVLPHFHSLGLAMTLDIAGGPRDGEEIFRSAAAYGDPLGSTFDPPIAVTGALGLGITCEYRNPRDQSVSYGIGDQEMCVVLIYTDSQKTGGLSSANLVSEQQADGYFTDGLCLAISTP